MGLFSNLLSKVFGQQTARRSHASSGSGRCARASLFRLSPTGRNCRRDRDSR